MPGVLGDVERVLPRFIKVSDRDVIHLVPVYSVDVKNVRVYGRALADITAVGKLIVVP
ncbi:MAG: hypothetical protein QW579_06825 [Desulfurococcaceae archaeon]